MAANSVVYAGTVGQGVWRSLDEGETFQRYCAGMFMEAEVRALAVHPTDPELPLRRHRCGPLSHDERRGALGAAGDAFRSRPGLAGGRHGLVAADPSRRIPICSLSEPVPPPSIVRRTAARPGRSSAAALTPECPPIVYSRVTCLLADPDEPETIWAGVEIDGVWRSRDTGETWQRLSAGLSSTDIHGLAIVPGTPRTRVRHDQQRSQSQPGRRRNLDSRSR